MTFQELIAQAAAQGYTQVNDGAETWDLDNFASENADDRDYTMDYNGGVSVYDAQGYEQAIGIRFTGK